MVTSIFSFSNVTFEVNPNDAKQHIIIATIAVTDTMVKDIMLDLMLIDCSEAILRTSSLCIHLLKFADASISKQFPIY